jgi:uncharacterized 2Fe-2S/4Fe-4S cluster protein (DUF4445 family)
VNIRFNDNPVICHAAEGETILLACARSGIMLSASCGGRRRCGKCTVQIIAGKVSGDVPDAEGRVRACAAIPVSDITIACPAGVFVGNELTAAAPLPSQKHAVDGAVSSDILSVAIDIGTTTVSARLIDVTTASVLDTVSELNDQRAYGADVMSRISVAKEGKTAELFTAINRQTQRIINRFRTDWDMRPIKKLIVSGNTVMLHLFLNIDPSGMGEFPFTPVFLAEKIVPGTDLSLPAETVVILPSISAFVGADITAGLAVLDIANIPGPALLVDIGTNGEMALAHKGTIYCCSTAAGPAFEGAEISCGSGGVSGAISAVEWIDNAVSVTTIGNVPAAGVCGSGLVDAVALMLKRGIIDETGCMVDTEKDFVLAPGIAITVRDIRQFQLAKSAIRCGIAILCKNAGLSPADIHAVFIAGGFGFFINVPNAITAGIFPPEFRDTISVCGNVSLMGAEQYLSDAQFLEKCKQIINRCSLVELAGDPFFTDLFAENMLFS